jgi:glyoxylase-like metal-dependent hydrolase (beta-lactamase superfamily II)
LREEGIDPASIDVVLATHIHIDHVGWHTTLVGDEFVPTFPKATHLFVKDEYDFFTSPEQVNNPALPWVNDCVLPLENLCDVRLVDAEYAVTSELTLLPTPGHTPAHSAVTIMSGGEAGVIIGDVCHHPAQVTETAWSPIFDLDPKLAAKTRDALMDRIERENWIAIAGHFAHPGFGRVVRVDRKRYWRAL